MRLWESDTGFCPGGWLHCRSSSVVISPPDGRHLRRGLLSARGFVPISLFSLLFLIRLIQQNLGQLKRAQIFES